MGIVVASRYIAQAPLGNQVSFQNTRGAYDVLSGKTFKSVGIVTDINPHAVNLDRLADIS